MNVSRIEELLEMLVCQHAEIIEKLDNIQAELRSVNEELNWVGETSFAKQVVDSFSEISTSVNSLEFAINSVETTILATQS